MKWNDLGLTGPHIDALKDNFNLEQPDDVVNLAWGSPDLLGRVIGEPEVEKIRQKHAFTKQSYDSSNFSLGARLAPPPSKRFTFGARSKEDQIDFVSARSDLLNQIEQASSPKAKQALEQSLVKLYESRQG